MPSSGKQTPEIQEQIKALLEAGFDPTTIHRKLKVGRSSIYRMKRCLQQYGTNYMPPEMNKKNGRPKVLTPDQELEVREWLRDPKNRMRYLDDLVWLIHDRFGIVCSTTTMSKIKRKWLRVIEFEETGQPIDDVTRSQLVETHPDLPLLLHPPQMPAAAQPPPSAGSLPPPSSPTYPDPSSTIYATTTPLRQTSLQMSQALQLQFQDSLQQATTQLQQQQQQQQQQQVSMEDSMAPSYAPAQPSMGSQLDSQLEQQLNQSISDVNRLDEYGPSAPQ